MPLDESGGAEAALTGRFVLCLVVLWLLRTLSCEPAGMVSRFVCKVRTATGAVAVQVVTRQGRRVEGIEHVGSAHTDAELALLLAAARERLAAGQEVLELGEIAEIAPRMAEVADWTGPRELPLPRGPVAAGVGRRWRAGRPDVG